MAKTTVEQIAALQARIAADTAKLNELQAAEKASSALETLAADAPVRFVFGRAENRKEYDGVVLGIAETDKGKRIKVQYGEGFDAQIVVIDPSAILSVGDAEKEADAPESTAQDAAADPLASIQ
ncbi:hypothetical protein [Pararobbsia alpina]|uniref:Uncharacterized protein n=1 Tax=Pararobbsia alpina TaxID=621374 RepID=A0A6S7BDB6_9BURK|nr:hypothetical protein [Pararobbsia alpina]CAB3795589.1 hypothetical protein LMG28138_03910 [Pararobbsia alpina]